MNMSVEENKNVVPEIKKFNDDMLFISDVLKKNHAGVDVYTHVIEGTDTTKNGKYIWYRLVVYNKQNEEIGNYKGLKLTSKAGNPYYKFINKNLLNLKDTHETINSFLEKTNDSI